MADSDDQRWLPMHQAIAEIAVIYHDALKGDYTEARAAAIDAIWYRLEYGAMVARSPTFLFAHRAVDGSEQKFSTDDAPEIPQTFWTWLRSATAVERADWVLGDFYFTGERDGEWIFGLATSVSIGRLNFPFAGHDRPQPTAELASIMQASQLAEQQRRGRPPKWDWEGALCHVIASANTVDGLPDGPGAQAEIGRMIASWFQENHGGEPVPSEIGKRAAMIARTLRQHRKKH